MENLKFYYIEGCFVVGGDGFVKTVGGHDYTWMHSAETLLKDSGTEVKSTDTLEICRQRHLVNLVGDTFKNTETTEE